MSYDIKELYNESSPSSGAREEGEEKIAAMFGEIRRLHEENQRLIEENRILREEVTLGRLKGEGFWSGLEPAREVEPSPEEAMPPEALDLFNALPFSFTFSELFVVAARHQIAGPDAKRYLKLLLDTRMLEQRGSRIQKAAETDGLLPPLRLPYR